MCADVEWDLSMAQRENRRGIKNKDGNDDDDEEEEERKKTESEKYEPQSDLNVSVNAFYGRRIVVEVLEKRVSDSLSKIITKVARCGAPQERLCHTSTCRSLAVESEI